MKIVLRDTLSQPRKLEVRRSGVHGYGVFAKEKISKGEIIEEACFVSLTDPKNLPDIIKDHAYQLPVSPEGTSNAALVLGYGMIYNHSEKPNVDYKIHQSARTFSFIADRDIISREELFIDYGDLYNMPISELN